jgi:MYXO-CTERM domain-containing protein
VEANKEESMRKLKSLALAVLMTAGLGSVALAQAQPADPAAQNTSSDRGADRDHGFDLGWLGLIGLVGLFGLRRRDRDADTVRTTHTPATAAR